MAYLLKTHTIDQLSKVKTPFQNAAGETPCAELVRQVTDAPQTKLWKRGARVLDCTNETIEPGTAIATFLYDEGTKTYYYPQTAPKDGRSMHAAIYQSKDDKQINVIDQWKGVAELQKRPLRVGRKDKDTARRSNIAEEFYVIE